MKASVFGEADPLTRECAQARRHINRLFDEAKVRASQWTITFAKPVEPMIVDDTPADVKAWLARALNCPRCYGFPDGECETCGASSDVV